MPRDTFVFRRSFVEAINELEPMQQLKMLKALIGYALDDELVELNSYEMAMFKLVKPLIDKSANRYDKCTENGKQGAEHGKKGGRPPTKPQEKPQTKPQEEPQGKPQYEKAKPLNDNDNVNDNVNVNVDVNDNVFGLRPELLLLVDGFWKRYPKKANKEDVYRWFAEHPEVNIDTVMQGLENHLVSKQWESEDGKFIPYPANWLTRQKWLEVLEPATQSTSIYSNVEDIIDKQQNEGWD